MSNDLVLKIIFAAGSLKENIWLENPGFYEPPLPVLRMFWLTSAEKKIIFGGGSLFPRLTAHCDSGNGLQVEASSRFQKSFASRIICS